eukprot:9501976-Pyramimonas_sp.AAC.1
MDMTDIAVEYTYRTAQDPSEGQAPGGVPEGTEPQGAPQSYGPDNPAPARAATPGTSRAPPTTSADPDQTVPASVSEHDNAPIAIKARGGGLRGRHKHLTPYTRVEHMSAATR